MDAPSVVVRDEQILGLKLDGVIYGIEIGRTQEEHIRMQPITALRS